MSSQGPDPAQHSGLRTEEMPLKVHKDIASLVPYAPGKPMEELERELGIAGAVKLASNENPRGPSPKARAVLSEAAHTLNRYPDGGGHRLRGALAERWKVTPDHVILGNGSDEIIGLLVRAFLSPGDAAVMADQTFPIYKMEVRAAHSEAVEVPLKNWRHDLPAMAEAVTARTPLLFLRNPDNPPRPIVGAGAGGALLGPGPRQGLPAFVEAHCRDLDTRLFPD